MVEPFISFEGGGAARLFYREVNISDDLNPLTTGINYTDHFHGENDEIDITVQDSDGRWKGAWFPEPNDTMQLHLSDDGVKFVDCGTFELDMPQVNGSRGGDFMTLRGLAAPVSEALRTQNTRAFEQMQLEAIVNQVAAQTGLTVEGKIEPLFFKRITQRKEKDLEFLTRLAEETGHYFSARGRRAIFTNYQSIDGRKPTLKIDLNDKLKDQGPLIDYNFKFQSTETYSKGSVDYADPDKKENVSFEMEDDRIKTGDELKLRGERVENIANAEAKLKATMHMKNRRHKTGSLTMIGNMKALSGNIIGATGFGRYNDNYVIDTSSHSVSRSGMVSTIEEMSVAKQF